MKSQKCSIVEIDGELILMAFHAHFLPHQQYSQVYCTDCLRCYIKDRAKQGTVLVKVQSVLCEDAVRLKWVIPTRLRLLVLFLVVPAYFGNYFLILYRELLNRYWLEHLNRSKAIVLVISTGELIKFAIHFTVGNFGFSCLDLSMRMPVVFTFFTR